MGFFGNTGIKGDLKYEVYKNTTKYLYSSNNVFLAKKSSRGVFPASGPTAIPSNTIKIMVTATAESYQNSRFIRINDDLSVTFNNCILGIKGVPVSEIPFKIGPHTSVYLRQVRDEVFDYLPETLDNLWINNAYRKDGSISFAKLKNITDYLTIDGPKIERLDLSDVNVGMLMLRNCSRIENLDGCPNIIGLRSEYGDRTRQVVGQWLDITGCANLKTISFPRCEELTQVNVAIKNCPVVKSITSLPMRTKYLSCETMDIEGAYDAIKAITGNDPKDGISVTFKNFSGKSSAYVSWDIIQYNHRFDDVKKQVMDQIDFIKGKHWRFFNDFNAIITYFGLNKYAGTNKSTLVRDNKIYLYGDGCGEYISIKSGVCKMLNDWKVRYRIENDAPRGGRSGLHIVLDI